MALWHQPLSLLPLAIMIYVGGLITLLLYRLFMHPLSRFPGPRIAAATGWYQTYWDVWRGAMTKNVGRLHDKYGPIVRIGPNSLHFSEPDAYNTIYCNPKLLKDPFLYEGFSSPASSFTWTNPHVAKGRREVLSPLFSRRAIVSLQWLVAEKFDKLCLKMRPYSHSGAPLNLFAAFRSTTLDIITSFCFAKSVNALDSPDFHAPILEAMDAALLTIPVFKHFPLLMYLVNSTPLWLAIKINPVMAGFLLLKKMLSDQIGEFLANPERLNDTPHSIIYHRLLDPNIKGASAAPATRTSLEDEAQSLFFAGSDTVGNALGIGIFHILERPEVYERLVADLKAAWPVLEETPSYEELEKIPYLTAVIKESLRVSSGVVSSLLRIVPASGIVISGEMIPAGTTVSMAAPIVHANEEIFPHSSEFRPERWMGADSHAKEAHLVAFSKGPRQCLGINLGYCELYMGFSRIFRRFEIKLHDTTREDLKYVDTFVPTFTGRVLGIVKCRES